MTVQYEHLQGVHSLRGAVAGFRYLSAYGPFQSVLDVGAGTGTWMAAAYMAGIRDVWGIEAAEPAYRESVIENCRLEICDLSEPVDLKRSFDCVICLEVAEHLEKKLARTVVSSLCRHGDLIFFSAAMPGQFGQGHVNCEWPYYWQALFNAEGFRCTDDIRWKIWDDGAIEPWYRQNMFRAIRDANTAGSEPRIASVVHPDMLKPPAAEAIRPGLRSYVPKRLKAVFRKAMAQLP